MIWYTQTGQEQYFDLEHDPQECRNRVEDPACAAPIQALRDILISELKGREEGYTDGLRLLPGRAPVCTLSHRG